uniref:D-3-phosphoglycerate dehydrogenase n=1 Tax=Eptatretus burgeri TaxID=7764 RepID=A0A8C4WZI7_EPTBU
MDISIGKVLISETVDRRCKEILEEAGVAVDCYNSMNKEQLTAQIKNYDALIVRSGTKVSKEVIAASDHLQVIGRAGTGVDNIDVDAATRHGVLVMNTPDGNSLSAAELTCGMILSLARNIPQAVTSLKAEKWERKKFGGLELYGKTLGVVGLGRIGREVAVRMQAFGMKTIGHDPFIPANVSAEFGVANLPLEEIWPLCDFITFHTPLMPSTRGLLCDETFLQCKPSVRVVNCARGGIVDEDSLLRALNSGRCGGAGLDVFEEEPPKNISLLSHHSVICTPHLGASTSEAQQRCGEDIARQIVSVIHGDGLVGAVNCSKLTKAFNPEYQPWLRLGIALGAASRALLAGSNVQVVTYGTRLNGIMDVFGRAVLMGILRDQVSLPINILNAPFLAEEAGLKLSSTHEISVPERFPACGGCSVIINTHAETINKDHLELLGSVLGDCPVLLAIGKASFMNAPLAGIPIGGHMLILSTKPGVHVLSTVLGTVEEAGSQLMFFTSSSKDDGNQWSIVRISNPLKDLSVLKTFVLSIVQFCV